MQDVANGTGRLFSGVPVSLITEVILYSMRSNKLLFGLISRHLPKKTNQVKLPNSQQPTVKSNSENIYLLKL